MGSKTTTKEMPEFQQRFLEDVMIPFSKGIADTEFEAYTGDRVAGLSDLEQQAMTGYGALTLPSEITTASDIVRDVATTTPQQRIDRINEIQNEIAPILNRRFAQQGIGEEAKAIKANAFGDRRSVYEGERQAALDTSALSLAQSQFDNEQAQRLKGAGALSNMGITGLGAMTDILGKQFTAGSAERGLTQAELDAEYNEFLRQYADPLRKFGVITGAAGAIPTGYGTTTEKDPMGQAGALLGGAGSFLTGAAPLMQPLIASDPRLKENVVEVGVDPATNLNLYEFNYIGDDSRRFRGVMADEVERNYPEAVAENDYGFKGVNYDLLNIEFKEVK